MSHRFISESRTIKVLLEPQGAIVAMTGKIYSYLFFVTREFVGFRTIRTRDQIVARAAYSAPGSLALIRELYPHGVRN